MLSNTMDPGLKIAGVTYFFVIPEIFYRESMFLNNLDPGSKVAGVTEKKNWSSKKRDCLVAGMYFPSIIDF